MDHHRGSNRQKSWVLMKTNGIDCTSRPPIAYSIVEVMVAVFLLGIFIISLFAGLSSGFAVVQLARENLRATQILVQKMESVRLYNWTELTNSAYFKLSFKDWYYPPGTNSGSPGVVYQGV